MLYIIFITAVLLLFKLSVVASTIIDTLYITIVSEASMCLFSAVEEVFFFFNVFFRHFNCFNYQALFQLSTMATLILAMFVTPALVNSRW